jgi:hypothetical protein
VKQNDKNDKENTHTRSQSIDIPEPDKAEGSGASNEPDEPSFKSNLIAFIKILTIAVGIILLIWFLDKGISGS